VADLTAQEALEAAKNDAYGERDQLVAALSKMFPASLERHPDEDTEWEDEWRWIVFIELPTGQATWHIHDSELPLFAHLPRETGRTWDGHTTPEKYDRLARLRAATPETTLAEAKLEALEWKNLCEIAEGREGALRRRLAFAEAILDDNHLKTTLEQALEEDEVEARGQAMEP